MSLGGFTTDGAQALWLDLCGCELWASSPGLRITIRP
jgi:hypothetical protein